jgi:hypothetical protein
MDSMERYGLVVVFVIVMFAGSLLGGYMSAMINGVLWLFERLFGVA